MKLHYKLYLFFAGVVLLPLLVATVAASLVLGRSGTETYENRIRSSLAASSAIISGEAQVLAGDFQSSLQVVDTVALGSGDPAKMVLVLGTLMEKTGTTGAAIIDDNGQVIARAGEDPAASSPHILSHAHLQGPGGKAWRVEVYQQFDTDAIGSVFSSQGLDWGLVDGSVTAQGSLTPGQSIVFSDSGETLVERPPENNGERFDLVKVDGREMLASLLAIPPEVTSKDTTLFAGIGNDVVGAASRQALTAGIIFMLLLSALAAMLGYFLARTITSPVRELNEAAIAGIGGNLDRRVDIRSKDELGSLADSFNMMQESIKQNIAEIEESRTQMLLALSYAGDILGSTTDRKRLVEITAQAARLATGAGGVRVELFESKETPAHEQADSSIPAGLFSGELERIARQLSHDVAAGKVASGAVVAIDGKLELAAFSMVHSRKALGAIVVATDSSRPLDDSGRQILASLALQAASALENVNYSDLQHALATTDQMTGLFNFRYLNQYLDGEMTKSRRYEHTLTVSIIDLDDFKYVNDTYSHLAGDELLKAVAACLEKNVRESDMVARYGGEEFVVVFPETNKRAATRVLEKLRKEIARVKLSAYPDVQATASIGVASFPDDADDQESLLKRADEALYRSKLAGKNRVSAA